VLYNYTNAIRPWVIYYYAFFGTISDFYGDTHYQFLKFAKFRYFSIFLPFKFIGRICLSFSIRNSISDIYSV
jgi:hypothetical protein